MADLSGLSFGYLAKIERGECPATKRSTLEAIANALRVSPTELTGTPYAPVDPLNSETHAALLAVETALETYDLGTDPEVAARPWPEIATAVAHLNEVLRPEADYVAQSETVPGLLADLHATFTHDPEHRADALIGLIYTYRSAAVICKNLGVRGLPLLATRLAQVCAEELGRPEWLGYAAYLRGIMGGPQNRSQQYTLSVRAIDHLDSDVSESNVKQVVGTLHLNAALAAAAQGDAERTYDHLDEAADLASRLNDEQNNFGGLYFGRINVGFWRISLGAELGEGAKLAEVARNVRPQTIPLKSWQGTFYADLGRTLAVERPTRERGIATCRAPRRSHRSSFGTMCSSGKQSPIC